MYMRNLPHLWSKMIMALLHTHSLNRFLERIILSSALDSYLHLVGEGLEEPAIELMDTRKAT